MPNLLPDSPLAADEAGASLSRQVSFGSSWRFDFDAGEFVLTPTGTVATLEGADAWVEWCRKALQTARYRHLAYGRAYGQEFEDLVARHLSRAANESEIRRMITECLEADPRTASVGDFTFAWAVDAVYVTCVATSARGDSLTVDTKVVVS